MSRSVPNLFGRASAVAADHAHLRNVWQSLREIVRSGGLTFHPRAEASKLIHDFASELKEHFAAEEADGYFGALVAERPELHALVERLRQEHREMLELVAVLLAPPGNSEAASERDLVMRDLLMLFHRHERAEAQMLQEFFGLDGGGEGS